MRKFIQTALIPIILTGLLLFNPRTPTVAQDAGEGWSTPTNLSQSGAASDPIVVNGPGNTLQAVWWDDFDGLTTAIFNGETWSDPVIAPIITFTEEGEAIWIVWEDKPLIISDNDGYIHAFWMDKADPFRPEIKRMLHSRMRVGTTSWTTPFVEVQAVLTYTVVRDPANGLALVYIRNEQSTRFPAGIYFRYVNRNDVSTLVYETRYFRGVQPEEAHINLMIDEQSHIYFAWDDPRLNKALYVTSTDEGETWSTPTIIGDDTQDTAQHPRFLDGPEAQILLTWEDNRATCALYQQVSADGGATWTARTRILQALRTCPQKMDTLRAPEGHVFLVGGSGSAQLTLAAWDGTRWSEPKSLSFSFEDPVVQQRVTLDKLQALLFGDTLGVVGFGQDGEVWFQQTTVSAMTWAFAPPSLWSSPVNISQGEIVPALPAMTIDNEGRTHVMWAELTEQGVSGTTLYYARDEGPAGATRWTRPARILASAGIAHQPDIVAVGDRLHAVWSGGENGSIFYSRAYVRDAYVANGWDTPVSLSTGMSGSWPRIVADLRGSLHAVYAVPLNEGRGLYYTRSDDQGETWTHPQRIIDAAAQGWAQVDHPTLAVDERRALHVAWVRAALPGIGLPEEILYIRSDDDGHTWTAPFSIATGAQDWPQVVTTFTGEVHVVWQETTGNQGWYHRWSADSGLAWSMRARLRDIEGVPGPVRVTVDGTGSLHLAALGYDDARQPAILYTTWQNDRWADVTTLRMEPGFTSAPGVTLALHPLLGQLHVAFRGALVNAEGAAQLDVFVTQRDIPAVDALPAAAFTPQPTPTPTATPTPLPTPTPRPEVNVAPPPSQGQAIELGPITLPIYAIGGILGAALVVIAAILLMGRRR